MHEKVKQIKVLYFVDRMLRGGIQTFVLENWKHMNQNKVQVDFLLLDDGVDYELEDTLREIGSAVFKLKDVWIRKPLDYINYYRSLNLFFKEHQDYDVVHLHSTSKNFMVLKLAKKYGIKIRIAHSHSTEFQSKSKGQRIVGRLFKPLLKYYATDYFACSELAGKWLFDNKKVHVIKNAVDIDYFMFNEKIRNQIRDELNLSNNDIVIGNVSRFVPLKNHTFLIDIFKEIHDQNNNFKLLFVGTGELQNEILNKVQRFGLVNDVKFIGFRPNVCNYLQAMDLFVFPSKFEGLGLVLIEAQASGLPCFTSKDAVPQEAKVSDLLEFIPLENNASEWARIILNCKIDKRFTPRESIAKKGYDISETALYLQNYYLQSVKSG